jgi:hypothetical protein
VATVGMASAMAGFMVLSDFATGLSGLFALGAGIVMAIVILFMVLKGIRHKA